MTSSPPPASRSTGSIRRGRPTRLSPDRWADVYEHEEALAVPAGSLVIYTMRTFHRGSTMTATAGTRASHHATLMRGDVRWGGWRNFARYGGQTRVDELVSRASARQRDVFGFPRPGDPYWTKRTLDEVEARYPDADWSRYRAAL